MVRGSAWDVVVILINGKIQGRLSWNEKGQFLGIGEEYRDKKHES